MGWASGSQLAEELWDSLKKYIPDKDRKKVAFMIYDKFCDHDADDWSYKKGDLFSIACPEEWKESQNEDYDEPSYVVSDEELEDFKEFKIARAAGFKGSKDKLSKRRKSAE